MRTNCLVLFASILLIGCTTKIDIPDLDFEKWKNAQVCSEYRIHGAELMQVNEDLMLNATQPKIEKILGTAPRHELSKRSEKFFYYPISSNCGDSIPNQSLLFRFDALGRVKEVLVVLD